jgi:hypothetical protein
MKKSMGTESMVLVREAMTGAGARGRGGGLAGLPAAVSSAFWMTIFCLG